VHASRRTLTCESETEKTKKSIYVPIGLLGTCKGVGVDASVNKKVPLQLTFEVRGRMTAAQEAWAWEGAATDRGLKMR
jgi:hypothetical protein